MNLPWPFSAGFAFAKAKPYDAKAAKLLEELHGPAREAHLRLGSLQEFFECGGEAHGSLSWAEEKLDGWRCLIVRDEAGVLHVYSRGLSKATGLPIDLLLDGPGGGGPLALGVADAIVERCTAIEGELVWPGHRATQVPEALKSHRGELRFTAFAMPFVAGRSCGTLRNQRATLRHRGVALSRIIPVGDASTAVHHYSAEALARVAEFHKLEGLVVKACCVEEPLWFKVKGEATDDVVVLDSVDANFGLTGKFDGQVGSLVVGVACRECAPGAESKGHECWEFPFGRVREVAQVGGMEDAERLEMTARRDDLPGRVCEIKFQRVGAKGRLRHPRFVRWRDDEKQARECVGDEVHAALGLVDTGGDE